MNADVEEEPQFGEATANGRDDRAGRRLPLVLVAVAVGAATLGLYAGSLLEFSFPNPFGIRTVDRSSAVLLRQIEDVSRYEAAVANFQVVVDLEKDVKYVPSVLAGQRALLLAQGSVDGYVDFTGLTEDAIEESADGRAVTVTLPPATLSKPRVDTSETYVISRERGVLDRVGGVFLDNPTSDKGLYLKAEELITSAAAQSDLRSRTEENTKAFLIGMLRGRNGFESVTVKFEQGALR